MGPVKAMKNKAIDKGLMTSGKRSPSAALANRRLAVRKRLSDAKSRAREVEARHRKAGGYGRAVVSIFDAPAGGITKSPAWRKVLTRCAKKSDKACTVMPPAHLRDGAPVKGGFPLEKYPVNTLVDGQRAYWVPDDWAQAVKNTGPGGIYIGWISPEGKYFYHRSGYPSAIEETLGRRLTALDGLNGVLRSVRARVNAENDKTFLRECLTAAERKHVLPKDKFHFAIVSARRAVSGEEDVMRVEAHFRVVGHRPTWYVDAASLEDYKRLGLDAVVGGKLTPARNMALDVAKKRGQICVQVSDDISKWVYFDVARQDYRGQVDFKVANRAVLGSHSYMISPVAAAQYMLAKMRSSDLKPRLGGIFPNANPAIALGREEFGTQHFILGDFFVAEDSPCRFDDSMTLKEDYDFTCSHLAQHGSVLRFNRMFVYVKHSTNEGGAVDTRASDGTKEQQNIAILQQKWPGVFKQNIKRKDEILMNWGARGRGASGGAREADAEGPSRGASRKTVRKAGGKAGGQASGKAAAMAAGAADLDGSLRYTGKEAKQAYITRRCKRLHGLLVRDSFGKGYRDSKGGLKSYTASDLRYDINRGFLEVRS